MSIIVIIGLCLLIIVLVVAWRVWGQSRIFKDGGFGCGDEVLGPARKGLAKELADDGWVLVTKKTCPWCIRQKEIFGDEAHMLTIIDCMDAQTDPLAAKVCEETWVYPSWVKAKGSSHNVDVRLNIAAGTHSADELEGLLQKQI